MPANEENGHAAAAVAAAAAAPSPALPFLSQDPMRDAEAGQLSRLRHSTSRASLPTTPRTGAAGDAAAAGAEQQQPEREQDELAEEEFAWGPSHPCFPHMNPHVALSSPEYASTRIIRVRRDWMQVGDLAPTFANLYPEILDPLVSEEEFRRVIKHVNRELIAAFSPWSARAWCDAALGVATLWLWEDVGLAGVKSRLKKLEAWIEAWNRDVGSEESVKIMPLRRTAYMTLDFEIPDPHISVDTNVGSSRPVTDERIQTPSHPPAVHYPIDVSPSQGDGGPHLLQGVAVETR